MFNLPFEIPLCFLNFNSHTHLHVFQVCFTQEEACSEGDRAVFHQSIYAECGNSRGYLEDKSFELPLTD